MTTIEFRAPWGRTVRVRTGIGLVLLGLPLLIVAVSLARCVRGYTLTEDAITVRRGIGTTRLAARGVALRDRRSRCDGRLVPADG